MFNLVNVASIRFTIQLRVLRNDTEGGGGTNPFVDLSILPRFQCSKMRLKAVNHTFQENILPPQCGQYSLQDSIAGF